MELVCAVPPDAGIRVPRGYQYVFAGRLQEDQILTLGLDMTILSLTDEKQAAEQAARWTQDHDHVFEFESSYLCKKKAEKTWPRVTPGSPCKLTPVAQ